MSLNGNGARPEAVPALQKFAQITGWGMYVPSRRRAQRHLRQDGPRHHRRVDLLPHGDRATAHRFPRRIDLRHGGPGGQRGAARRRDLGGRDRHDHRRHLHAGPHHAGDGFHRAGPAGRQGRRCDGRERRLRRFRLRAEHRSRLHRVRPRPERAGDRRGRALEPPRLEGPHDLRAVWRRRWRCRPQGV